MTDDGWLKFMGGVFVGFIAGALFAVVFMSIHAAQAQQHMHPDGPAVNWYEPACCNTNHCHPVDEDDVQDTRDGLVVKGYGLLLYDDPRIRWSRDNRNHVCDQWQRTLDNPDGKKLLCVYRQPRGT